MYMYMYLCIFIYSVCVCACAGYEYICVDTSIYRCVVSTVGVGRDGWSLRLLHTTSYYSIFL
jgi:hypothetical protein